MDVISLPRIRKNVRGENGGIIDSFREEYYFLSNFYDSPIEYNGLTFKNVEAAFQAQKCLDEVEKEKFCHYSAAQARSEGQSVKLRDDWESIKLRIMTELVYIKFGNEELYKKLKATGSAKLIEGNTWGDTYWGMDSRTGEGENHLGKILMKIRDIKESYLYEVYLRLQKDDGNAYAISMDVVACDDEDAIEKAEFYVNSGNSGYIFKCIETSWLNGNRKLIPV